MAESALVELPLLSLMGVGAEAIVGGDEIDDCDGESSSPGIGGRKGADGDGDGDGDFKGLEEGDGAFAGDRAVEDPKRSAIAITIAAATKRVFLPETAMSYKFKKWRKFG
ncbi:hypothetical protein HPP92_018461 [Vanilla planifolia]|uniref:Uncharacterized protein n=1 Tax=Vanilla planifolia TaxID=51239 RepID=A0A835UNZ8_VANPL|nr:hypothetical protein HPP92_019080 [Vanilla planifolia]KAG0469133.1 hypothetical protein HPP92_018461 [Vanilla planifolia]